MLSFWANYDEILALSITRERKQAQRRGQDFKQV